MNTPSKDKTAQMHSLPAGSVSIRAAMHFPEGPLYHDAPRPDSTTNEFCLACHSKNDIVSGLTVEALRYKNGVLAKMDPRRQPTQPHTFISGNIPTSFVDSFKGNKGAIGSGYIDDYMMPSSAGVLPTLRSLVQMQSEKVVKHVYTIDTLARNDATVLRGNTSGLANRVWFYVNGNSVAYDDAAPFELPVSKLVTGKNEVKMYVRSGSGLQNVYIYPSITVQ